MVVCRVALLASLLCYYYCCCRFSQVFAYKKVSAAHSTSNIKSAYKGSYLEYRGGARELEIEPNDSFKANEDWWKDPFALFDEEDDDHDIAVGQGDLLPTPRPAAKQVKEQVEKKESSTKAKISSVMPKTSIQDTIKETISGASLTENDEIVDAISPRTKSRKVAKTVSSGALTVRKTLLDKPIGFLRQYYIFRGKTGITIFAVLWVVRLIPVIWVTSPRLFRKMRLSFKEEVGLETETKTQPAKDKVVKNEDTLIVDTDILSDIDSADEYDLDLDDEESEDESEQEEITNEKAESSVSGQNAVKEKDKTLKVSSPSLEKTNWLSGLLSHVKGKSNATDLIGQLNVTAIIEEKDEVESELVQLKESHFRLEKEHETVEKEYEKVSAQLLETTHLLDSLQSSNRHLQDQLQVGGDYVQRAVQAEQQKAKAELLKMKEAMIQVIERERELMRQEFYKQAAELQSMWRDDPL